MNERSRDMLSRNAMRVTGRWTTVLLTIAAWFLLSNHCALALGLPLDSEPGGCPMHSAPAKGKAAPTVPCCKDLRAVASHAAKNLAAANQLLGVQDYAATVLASPRVVAQLLALNTGPPRSLSFAESILQRSILAHAPPAGFPRV